uniref:Major sperm protein n=1 Tax=Romanomermis culicivorax TaxID=13658 RepID=A0A915IBB6_ROMCU
MTTSLIRQFSLLKSYKIIMSLPSLINNVELNPKDCLVIVGKMNVDRQVTFTIRNKTSRHIAYKMKHTSPTIVRILPGYGYLNGSEIGTITVKASKSGSPMPNHPQRITILLSYTSDNKPDDPVMFWRGAVNARGHYKKMLPFVFSETPIKDVSKIIEPIESEEDEED